MKKYTRISLEEREKIYLLLRQGLNITCIAKILQRNKSSISRELKNPLGYIPDRAHFIYRINLSRNKLLFQNKELQNYVLLKLTISRWTPTETSASLKLSIT